MNVPHNGKEYRTLVTYEEHSEKWQTKEVEPKDDQPLLFME